MLSFMAGDFFASSQVLFLPIAGLVLFVLAFTLATVRVMRRPRAELEPIANLPLEQDRREP